MTGQGQSVERGEGGHGATALELLCLTLSAALRLVEKEEERGRVMAVASACGEASMPVVFLEGCGFSCSSCGTAREPGVKRARGHMAAYHGAGCVDDAGGWAGNRNGVLLRGVMVVLAGLRHGKSGRHGRERDGERLWSLRLKNRVRHGGENLEGRRRRRGATRERARAGGREWHEGERGEEA